jgi:hypothetical protein
MALPLSVPRICKQAARFEAAGMRNGMDRAGFETGTNCGCEATEQPVAPGMRFVRETGECLTTFLGR